jgi:hypothetical protein
MRVSPSETFVTYIVHVDKGMGRWVMYEIALVLSIISSVLVIVYLIGLIFGKRQSDQNQTITISGRIVTSTVTRTEHVHSAAGETGPGANQGHRVVDGEVLDAKALQSQIENILKNVK